MKHTTGLKDVEVHVKFKLSALWIAVMFCYVYGDFFSLFIPGHIQALNDGNSGVGATSPVKLLLFAIMMALPAMMIFLSVALRAQLNRILNVVLGLFFTMIMMLVVATSISDWRLFYTFLGVLEIVLTLLIVWYAWKWERV